MSLVVEDGTSLDTAESVISVSDADTYHRNRGNSAWGDLSTPAKEEALRKANDYLRQTYRSRWRGMLNTYTQGCDWPRVGAVVDDVAISGYFDNTTIPQQVKDAAAELALRASSEDLLADQTQQVTSEQVGSMKVTYASGSTSEKKYPAIERLLAPLLNGRGGINHRVVRS